MSVLRQFSGTDTANGKENTVVRRAIVPHAKRHSTQAFCTMLKLTVEQILAGIEALSLEEREELKRRLSEVLGTTGATATTQEGQFMTNTLGDVQISGSAAAFNYQPSQAGGDINVSAEFSQQGSTEREELLPALAALKEAIRSSESIPELLKTGAETQIDHLAQETQKEHPDQNLIGRTVSALKQGLKGVQDLAAPTAAVASIVAKAWGIPVP